MAIKHIEIALEAYKNNFVNIVLALILQIMLIGIPFLIGIVPWLFVLLKMSSSTPAALAYVILSNVGFICFSFVFFIIGALVSILLNCGFVRMLYESLRGTTEIRSMVITAKEKFWTILGANLLVLLIMIFIAIIVFIPLGLYLVTFINFSYLLSFVIMLLILFLGLSILVSVSIFFMFINQAIVIDNLNFFQAIEKSFYVARKNFKTILALFTIFFLVNLIISIIPFFGTLIEWFVVTPITLLSYTSIYIDFKKTKRK